MWNQSCFPRAICVSIQDLGALRRMYGKSERMDGSKLSRGEEHLSLAQLFTIGVGPSSSPTFLGQIADRICATDPLGMRQRGWMKEMARMTMQEGK